MLSVKNVTFGSLSFEIMRQQLQIERDGVTMIKIVKARTPFFLTEVLAAVLVAVAYLKLSNEMFWKAPKKLN